jgi:multidrug efflux pump subunit AcrB
MAMFFIFGWFGYRQLSSTFFPIYESRVITIQAVYPGASPEEIEEGVIIKIEDNLKGVTGVERVTSVSRENSGSITVEVLRGYDADLVIDDVRNAVDQINSFPGNMEPVVVYKVENTRFTINFALSAENIDLLTLKKIARQIENDLRKADGISKVSLSGFPEEEIEIAFHEDDLRAYNISFDEAAAAIRASNIRTTGGTIKGDEEELLIRANARAYFAEGYENIVIRAVEGGKLVRVKDVADVRDRWADNPSRVHINASPAVVVQVSNTDSENIIETSAYINEYVKSFNEENDIIKATVIRDQAVVLNQRKELLFENGMIGIFLVLVLLSLFLNWRIAFWVAASLPVSFFGMFILANYFGVTINVISLFGMIVVVGILVDDGIVVSENIFQHYEKGKNPVRAAIDGTLEVLPAVTSAVLTTIIAFSTFFFLDGRSGDFFSEMSVVVISTLAISLIEVIIILPSHVSHSDALVRKRKIGRVEMATNKFMRWMRDRFYAPSLRYFLKNRAFALAIPIALFMITIGAFQGGIIRAQYFPFIESDNFSVNLKMPAGTPEKTTNGWLEYIEGAVWEINEELKEAYPEVQNDLVKYVVRNMGPTTSEGSLDVALIDGESRPISSGSITQMVREKVGIIYEAENLSFGSFTPFGKPVSVSLLSNNNVQLEAAKNALKEVMLEMDGLRDVIDNDLEGIKEVNIRLKDRAYLMGLSLQEVSRQIRQGFFGFEVQRIQRGIDEVKVWVRYDEASRKNIGQLEDMRLRLPDGRTVPVQEVVDYSIERGSVSINHLDGQREIKVEADVSDDSVDPTSIMADLRENVLPEILAQYPSVTPLYEGQNREAGKTMNSGKKVIPVVLLLIIAIITFTFRSFGQTIAIFILIPFAFIGVSWGHWIHGQAQSIFSYLGIVALIGIIVNDSLVLVSKMNNFLKEGMPFREAVYNAGLARFRAIFLTTITTVAGLAPLILEKSFQAQFLIPMAISVAYGIMVATVLTLVVLPVLLTIKNDILRYFLWAWNWEKGKKLPSPESVEPAVKELESETLEKLEA